MVWEETLIIQTYMYKLQNIKDTNGYYIENSETKKFFFVYVEMTSMYAEYLFAFLV
jgi:hypothetical protein